MRARRLTRWQNGTCFVQSATGISCSQCWSVLHHHHPIERWYSWPTRAITINIAQASIRYVSLRGKLLSRTLLLRNVCQSVLYLNTMLVTCRCNNKALSSEAPLKLVQPRVVPNLFIKLVRRRAACGTSHCLLELSTLLQTQHQFSTVPIKFHGIILCLNYMFIHVFTRSLKCCCSNRYTVAFKYIFIYTFKIFSSLLVNNTSHKYSVACSVLLFLYVLLSKT